MDTLCDFNYNQGAQISSYTGLKDLNNHPDGTFEGLLNSQVKKTSTAKDDKLLDLLLRGFTLNSRIEGGFDEVSAQPLIGHFVKNFVPGYLQSVLVQILKFKDPNAVLASIAQIISPDNLSEDKKVTKVSLDNFKSKIEEKLSSSNSHFADLFDLGDYLGNEISSHLNMGGIFVKEMFEGVLDQATDNVEIGIFRWGCHVEVGIQIDGLMEFLSALYYRMK